MTNVMHTLARAATPQLNWKRSDAMDAIFFLRVLQAIVFGVSFGFLGLEGLYPFLTYLATSLVIPSMWFRYQGIDDEHFGSGTADADDETIAAPQPIGMEAIGPGLSMFMLCWIITFTLVH